MKKFTTIMAVFASVFLMVSVTGCISLAGLKNDASEVATYTAEEAVGTLDYSVIFYSDNSFDFVTESSFSDSTYAKGTYTGNPAEDGKISITVTKIKNGIRMQTVSGEKYTTETTVKKGKADLSLKVFGLLDQKCTFIKK